MAKIFTMSKTMKRPQLPKMDTWKSPSYLCISPYICVEVIETTQVLSRTIKIYTRGWSGSGGVGEIHKSFWSYYKKCSNQFVKILKYDL
jgi:hypothetical protein